MEPTLVFSAVTGLAAIGVSWWVARQYQIMGGGAAQQKLNATYRELNDAFEDKIAHLEKALTDKDQELGRLRKAVQQLRTEVIALRKALKLTDATVATTEERTTALEHPEA